MLSNKLKGLVKGISQQNGKVAFWFLIPAYSKMQDYKDLPEGELLKEGGN